MLDYVLIAALVLCVWQIIRMRRQIVVLRHLFFQSSDASARIIGETVESARSEIMDMAILVERDRGHDLDPVKAADYVPFVVTNAKTDWVAQKERFQAMLEANGMRALNTDDLDAMHPHPKWLKHATRPKRL